MNKLGKLDKYIHNDLKNFSSDVIRRIISNQDDNLNISLKQGVGVSQFSETYDPNEKKYVGSITLTVNPDILQVISEAVTDNRPMQVINPSPSPPSTNNNEAIRQFLRGETNVIENAISDSPAAQSIINKYLKSIQTLKQTGLDDTTVDTSLISETSTNNNPQINMQLAGARESATVNNLEDRIGFRYRQNLAGSRPQPNSTIDTSTNSQPENAVSYGKSTLFFDSSGAPKIFNDYNFNVYKHYEEVKDILNFAPTETYDTYNENPPLDLRSVDNILKFRVKLEYNFLLKNYESFLEQNPSLSVLNLPYFYELLEFKLAGNVPELSDYDGIPGTFSDAKSIKNTSFLNSPENIINTSSVRQIVENLIINSNLGISANEKTSLDKYLKKFNPFKEQFPFYAEIKISTHRKPQTNLSNLFHEYNLYSKFLSDVKSNSLNSNFYNKLENNIPTPINLQGYLFNETFIENLFNSNIVVDPILFFKLNSVLSQTKRDFTQVLNGVQSHTEVIGYVLQKYEKNSSNILQEWVLPNIGEDYLEWIDTQIKLYDVDGKSQQYTYKVNLLVLSVGTTYEYYNPENPDGEPISINGNNVTLFYRYKPQFTVFQIENSAEYTNYISDKPPIEPDVSIIPYVGVDNKVKFNLNSGIGKFDAVPIVKNNEEQNKFSIISTAQDRIDNKITFESDEPADLFEIYRIDFKPKNYNDIFNGRLTTLATNGGTAASFDDDILPNMKYYYAVRCQDYHKNYSNLSKIFEVELINNNGTIYPNIQLVDFDKQEELKQDFKTFRRYLKISPALIQKTVDPSSVTNSTLKMGLSTEAVWNKNMKIRLISKQTGRKIDLKFKFLQNVRKID